MSMLRTCAAPDCETLTLGEFCLQHEAIQKAAPFVGTARLATAATPAEKSTSASAGATSARR